MHACEGRSCLPKYLLLIGATIIAALKRMRLKNPTWEKIFIATLILAIWTTCIPSVEASTIRVKLLVAYDEEWASIAKWQYAYSPETLAYVIIYTVHCRFHDEFAISFQIVDYQSYDSDDSLTDAYARFDEATLEVQSNHSFNILVAFTGQSLMHRGYRVWGVANQSDAAVLVRHYYPFGVGQATDEILQHEVSHLYGAPDHYKEGLNCVMNVYPYWIGFPYYYYVVTAVTTQAWCDGCKNIIRSNRELWGRAYGGEGDGGGGSAYKQLRPEDPSSKKVAEE
jgi:hypothetical protein